MPTRHAILLLPGLLLPGLLLTGLLLSDLPLGPTAQTAWADESLGDAPASKASTAGSESGQLEFFEKHIRPVLVEHCYACHSADAKIVRGGLWLDSLEDMLSGGDSGPAIIPGDAANSLLLQAVKYEVYEMPPKGKLDEKIIADIESWIASGAHAPQSKPSSTNVKLLGPTDPTEHWSFGPLKQTPLPQVSQPQWTLNPIDHYVLNKLESHDWQPAPAVSEEVLLRRVTYNLLGLPPTPQQIEAYANDQQPGRYERFVDRLLASPEYGARWARHWLDCVRYADTNGADENHDMPNAWRYRDWVVKKLNEDLAYDQFVTHQLAGDLLPVPEDESVASDLLTATGMLVIGPKMLAEQDKAKMRIDIVDEQLDTISKTFLGLTLSCARCHDHKFDPFPTEDYYALAGIFASTRTMADAAFVSNWMERSLPSAAIDAARAEHQQKIDEAKSARDSLIETARRSLIESGQFEELPQDAEKHFADADKQAIAEASKQVEELEKAMPQYEKTMAVEEGNATNLPVHIRGNHLQTSETETARGVPECLSACTSLAEIPENQSGRLQFAAWLTSPENPLTARVFMNRLWMWHFGQPLMDSPSNFGYQSAPPEHAELLDYLAKEFMKNGWSIKSMHRLIVTSQTYRMTSQHENADAELNDPENRMMWRQNRKRLEIEPLRDAVLAVSDSLDYSHNGAPVGIYSNRRSIYVKINRAALDEMFSTFDYVDPASHIPQRPTTIVPHQALFFLNNQLVHRQSQTLARQLLQQSMDDQARVQELWIRLFGRNAHDWEIAAAQDYVQRATELVGSPESSVTILEAWQSLIRSLVATSEFSYIP